MERDVAEERVKTERRLTAILHADVVGYSKLMARDETGTHKVLVTSFDTITPLVTDHHGRIVNFAGDAVLAEFSSAVDALTCAVEIQRMSETWNADLSDEDKIHYRIGINIGDVIASRDDIYGDGVNIAARLQALAHSGGICISGTVFDQVRNKSQLGFEFLGEQSVKNIVDAVRTYRVLLEPEASGALIDSSRSRPWGWQWAAIATVVLVFGIAGMAIVWTPYKPEPGVATSNRQTTKLPAKPSIAVLPFKNIRDDQNQDYFSDGLTEDIITDLSKFDGLFVIASNASFAYKGKSINIREVGQQLGVRYILQGSVQRSGEKVRVNAQLIDATQGHHVWADRLIRNIGDLFSLQDELVQTIVATLAAKVDTAERERALRKKTSNMVAYDYVLRGREHLSRSTSADNEKARNFFRKAIELDPRYGTAYVALGQSYLDALRYGWSASPRRSLTQIQDLSQKALSIDQRNAGAHRLLGYAFLKRNEYSLATKEFQRALALNPNDADSHDALGSVWLYTGRTDDAIAAIETARRFNPNLQASGLIHLGLAYYLKSRFDDAIRTLELTLGQNPNLTFLHLALAASYAKAGRQEDAQRAASNVRRRNPFFKVELFGNAFKKPEDRASIQDGLRMAGLN